MPNRKELYSDMEKFKKTRNAQKQRYYSKTAIYGHSQWTSKQDKMVLEHKITDTELSVVIGHSVNAIQRRRWSLKRRINKEEIN